MNSATVNPFGAGASARAAAQRVTHAGGAQPGAGGQLVEDGLAINFIDADFVDLSTCEAFRVASALEPATVCSARQPAGRLSLLVTWRCWIRAGRGMRRYLLLAKPGASGLLGVQSVSY